MLPARQGMAREVGTSLSLAQGGEGELVSGPAKVGLGGGDKLVSKCLTGKKVLKAWEAGWDLSVCEGVS